MKFEVSYLIVFPRDEKHNYITTRTTYAKDAQQAVFHTGQWAQINKPSNAEIGHLLSVVTVDAPLVLYRQTEPTFTARANSSLPPGPKGGD